MPTIPKPPPPPTKRNRKMDASLQSQKANLRSTRSFSGSLNQIRAELGLSPSEFSALRRALHDVETRKDKTSEHHEEDESWLDWAIGAAKKYGPQLVKLLELAA